MKVGNIIAASAIVAALGLPASTIAMAGAMTDLVDSYWDAEDQYHDSKKRSQRALSVAMNEGALRPPPPDGSTIDYLLRMYDRTDYLYRQSDEIFQIRRLEINGLLGLSLRLRMDDPLRAEFEQEARELNGQQLATRKSRDDYHRRRQAFGELIQDYKKRTGSYPPHDCASASGWHLPEGAKCDSESTDPHAGSSGHGP